MLFRSSVDCGKTWTLRYNKSGTALATAGVVTAAFTPTTLTQWRQETVPAMGTFSNQPNVRLMFSYNYTGDGNNIYIDDINVNGTVGIDDLEAGIQNLMLQPNPAKGETNLHFILSKNSVASITICDVAGRVADKRNLNSLPAGEYNYRIGQNLNPGIYFVQLTIDNKELVQKLVIE